MTDSPGPDTTAVLLAAGSGSRLGLGPKALLPFGGRTLVEVLADVVVVLGADAATVGEAANLKRHTVVENPQWPSGMGSSFRAGSDAAPAEDHVLVALVDQPRITAETARRLISLHRPGRITAAGCRDEAGTLRRGHPLLLDATLKEAAAATAKGDAGARLFLQAHQELVDVVDCSDQSGGQDVDTPDQLRLLR